MRLKIRTLIKINADAVIIVDFKDKNTNASTVVKNLNWFNDDKLK